MRNSLGERKPTQDDGRAPIAAPGGRGRLARRRRTGTHGRTPDPSVIREAMGNGGDQPGSRLVPQPDAAWFDVLLIAAGSRK
ncbi:Secreted protein OS=Streptomyces glaucescens OX=1907 GN=SGLAU_12310 PE=4 SV=1 [Streptomyces glaucescens]